MKSDVLGLEKEWVTLTHEFSNLPSRDEQVFAALDPRKFFETWLADLHARAAQQPLSDQPSGRGEISFDGVVNVTGHVSADIRSSCGALFVAASAEIDGDVQVETAIINGVVRGDITASHLQLGSTARVIGHIQAAELSIHAGAVFEGQSAYLSNGGPRHLSARPSSLTNFDEETPGEFAVLAVA